MLLLSKRVKYKRLKNNWRKKNSSRQKRAALPLHLQAKLEALIRIQE
jgi:hypothetical protein